MDVKAIKVLLFMFIAIKNALPKQLFQVLILLIWCSRIRGNQIVFQYWEIAKLLFWAYRSGVPKLLHFSEINKWSWRLRTKKRILQITVLFLAFFYVIYSESHTFEIYYYDFALIVYKTWIRFLNANQENIFLNTLTTHEVLTLIFFFQNFL